MGCWGVGAHRKSSIAHDRGAGAHGESSIAHDRGCGLTPYTSPLRLPAIYIHARWLFSTIGFISANVKFHTGCHSATLGNRNTHSRRIFVVFRSSPKCRIEIAKAINRHKPSYAGMVAVVFKDYLKHGLAKRTLSAALLEHKPVGDVMSPELKNLVRQPR